MYELDFHADDYAASVENSRRILSLLEAGRIDSISVIVNMSCYGECMDMLRDSWSRFPKKPLLSLHINLIDGRRLSSPGGKEIIRRSWGQLLFGGFLPGGKQLREACAEEIGAQLEAFLERTAQLRDDGGRPLPLRIDGHVHTHMTPLVFRALTDALSRAGLLSRVSFIRCSAEPLAPFLFTPGVAFTLSPVNVLKNRVLHLLSFSVRRKLRRMGLPAGRVFGIALTGEMDTDRVRRLLPKMKRYARGKDVRLEVMAHPGRTLPAEITEEYGPDDRRAFLSPKRDLEYRMLLELSDADRLPGGAAESGPVNHREES